MSHSYWPAARQTAATSPLFQKPILRRSVTVRGFHELVNHLRITGNPFLDKRFHKRGPKMITNHKSNRLLKNCRRPTVHGAKYSKNSQVYSQIRLSVNTDKHPQSKLEGRERTFNSAFQIKTNNNLRPSPNERTCMGWHKRHASVRRGWRGIYVPRR